MGENSIEWISQLSSYTPWLIGVVAAIAATIFLTNLGKWEKTIPWQVRAFTRVLILVVFVYLLQLGVIAFLPEEYAGKVKIFSDGIALTGDIFKTLMGAVIGALSVSMKEVNDENGHRLVSNTTTESEK